MARRLEDDDWAEPGPRSDSTETSDLDEVLDLMIHELRNPVAVLKGFASTLTTSIDQLDRDAILAGAAAITRGADRLDALLASMKDARSLDLEDVQLHLDDVLLSELVTEVVEDQRAIDRERTIEITIEDDAQLRVDPVRIRQILANLISNADKFSSKVHPIAVVASRHGDQAHICVKDQGGGIPKERLGQLFQRFSRLGRGGDGTGIGLYISRGLARAHGGELRLSENNNEGCTFLLELPIYEKTTVTEMRSEGRTI